MSVVESGWENTLFWHAIKKQADGDDHVVLTIKNCMPGIETILRSGGTSALDFTLHDDNHGFRVSQMMFRLIPEEVLNHMDTYELSLLLLSAYLHDIGMTPTRDAIKRHFNYIITAEQGLLAPVEILELQKWLDEERNGLELPISDGKMTPEKISEAEDIIAYYSRHKHNDWSEDWIREYLPNTSPGLYPSWIDDLVTLCRSHHDGLAELRTDRFNSRIAGNHAQIVNLRYLAALLRVADVLEFNPERTPEIILTHRSIAAKSRVYWYKDAEISFDIDAETPKLHFAARTPNALIHRAVLETARWANAELLCCSILEHEGAFLRGTIPTGRRYHKWPWPAQLTVDVSPKDRSFVYIEGAFRPNTRQVLELLSGTALYGNPLAAVREVLQNAVDAVQEQIARERLAQDNPADNEWDIQLGNIHKITLKFLHDTDGYWLVCTDDGVGMTKEIIERHLLVSGSHAPPEVLSLARAARKNGFNVGRTGQFGIGVLSYFMIADRVTMKTRRSAEAGGDPDNTAWQFSIDGLDTFGQLSPISRSTKGTEVRLRLKAGLIKDDPDSWYSQLKEYVSATVIRIPCRFELRCEQPSEVKTTPAGWAHSSEDFSSNVVESLDLQNRNKNVDALLTFEEIQRRTTSDEKWIILAKRASETLRWFGSLEGTFASNLGQYRISLPYFSLPGGASIAFADIEEEQLISFPGTRDVAIPRMKLQVSWKGFGTSLQLTRTAERELRSKAIRDLQSGNDPFLVELDLIAGGTIAAHRNSISINENLFEEIGKMQELKLKLYSDFMEKNRDSIFFDMNNAIFRTILKDVHHQRAGGLYGKTATSDGSQSTAFRAYKMKYVSSPVAEILFEPIPSGSIFKGFKWMNNPIDMLNKIKTRTYGDEVSLLQPYKCDRLALINTPYSASICVIREDLSSTMNVLPQSMQYQCKFPPEWHHVAIINTEERVLWNSENPLVKIITQDAVDWVRASIKSRTKLEDMVQGIISNPPRLAAWLASSIDRGFSYYKAIEQHFPDVVCSLRDIVREESQAPLLIFWNLGNPSGRGDLMVFTQSGWNKHHMLWLEPSDSLPHSADQEEAGGRSWLPLPKEGDWWINYETHD